MDTCPSFADLQLWLTEKLPAQNQEDVARHLSDCGSCQAALDGLTEFELPTALHDRPSKQQRLLSYLQQQLKLHRSDTGEKSDPEATVGFEPTSEPAIPIELEKYEMLEELGRGGMGVVYKAREIALDRFVAVKMILHGSSSTSEQRLRFQREARAIARLDHPNIVRIHEIGEHEGNPFFSLELVTGGSLSQKLSKQPMAPMETARLVESLAHGIEAAHQEGVIHRDLKPANVLLTETCVPRITDFGLAKQLDLEGDTSSGMIMGTPAYMAPEQVARKTTDVTPSVDVHALGAILFECLTGEPPFKAATQVDTILKVISHEVRFPAHLRTTIPIELQIICLKCLEKNTDRRYISAAALAEDLRRFQKHEPISAKPVSQLERAWRWCKRNPLVAGLLIAIFAVLLSGISVSTFYYLNEKQAREKAGRLVVDKTNLNNALVKEQRKLKEEKKKLLAALIRESQEIVNVQKKNKQLKAVAYAYQLETARQLVEKGETKKAQGALQNTDPLLRDWEYDFWFQLTLPEKKAIVELKGHSADSNVSSVAFDPQGKRLVSSSNGPHGEVIVWDSFQHKIVLRIPNQAIYGIRTAILSSDGKKLATGGSDSTLRLWNLESGKQIHVLRGHSGVIKSAAFSPDGRWVATGSLDKTVKIWDVNTGEAKLTFNNHKLPISTIAVSPDGKYIASATEGRMIVSENGGVLRPTGPVAVLLWESSTGRIIHQFTLSFPVSKLAFNPNGKQILSTGGTAKLWDLTTGRECFSSPDDVFRWAFSPDGKTIATTSLKSEVLWNTKTGKELVTLRGNVHRLHGLTFSPNGKRIAGVIPTFGLRIWDSETGEVLMTWNPPTRLSAEVAFSPDSAQIAAGGFRGLISLLGVRAGKKVRTFRGHQSVVLSTTLGKHGKQLSSVSGDGVVIIRDTLTQKVMSTFPTESSARHAAFDPNGRWLAVGDIKGNISVWSMSSKTRKWSHQRHTGIVTHFAFSPDGKRMASAARDRTAIVWDIESGREEQKCNLSSSHAQSVGFLPDGRPFAIDLSGSTIRIWDVQSRKQISQLDGTTSIATMKLSPDGRMLVTGTILGQVTIWDVKLKKPLANFKMPGFAMDFIFSRDGSILAGVSNNTVVTIWKTATWKEIDTFEGHFETVRCVAFSDDGRSLITGSDDFNVKIRELATALSAP